MEERSLRVVGTDKTFFNKLTNTLNKLLIPTQVKAFEMAEEEEDASKKETADKNMKMLIQLI